MEILRNPEELIICPYNRSHHIRRNKMGFHLVKCKKNYPKTRMVSCDFNVTHQIPKPEIQYHHEHCPNRKDVEITMYRESNQEINKYPIHNKPVQSNDSCDDYNVISYNPNAYCNKNDLVRTLNVESATKKKNFHIMERERLKHVSNNGNTVISFKTVKTPDQRPTKKPISLCTTPAVQNTTENTPDIVTDLLHRIRLGSNTPFNSAN